MCKSASLISLGTYRHFKGNLYEVIMIAKHSETLEDIVVYQQLYGEKGYWVRPLSMFNEYVMQDGIKIKRFTKVD